MSAFDRRVSRAQRERRRCCLRPRSHSQ